MVDFSLPILLFRFTFIRTKKVTWKNLWYFFVLQWFFKWFFKTIGIAWVKKKIEDAEKMVQSHIEKRMKNPLYNDTAWLKRYVYALCLVWWNYYNNRE